MKKYGLVGLTLTHTMSPYIHKKLFQIEDIDANYELYEFSELNEKNFKELKTLNGFNITIPYKNIIIPFLDELSEKAATYQSVNTVKNNGSLLGFNTDVDGFLKSIEKLGGDLSGSVLVLGAGGVARMAVAESALRAKNITIAVRNTKKAEYLIGLARTINKDININVVDINSIEGSFDICINCTPVGMYPNIDDSPIKERDVKKCKAVFDLIYNPEKTKLMALAEKNGIEYIGGMYMLVIQAAKAHEIWNGASFKDNELTKLTKECYTKMKIDFNKSPVAFIGFMASGKTTLAKEFAKNTNREFIDTDKEIEKREGKPVERIFTEQGEEYFRLRENEILCELVKKENCVISTGGGAPVYNSDLLKQNSIIIYIDTPFELCYKRLTEEGNRPIANNNTKEKLYELYKKRNKIYSRIADIVINGAANLDAKLDYLKEHF